MSNDLNGLNDKELAALKRAVELESQERKKERNPEPIAENPAIPAAEINRGTDHVNLSKRIPGAEPDPKLSEEEKTKLRMELGRMQMGE